MTKPVRLVRKSRAQLQARLEDQRVLGAADVGVVADGALGATTFVPDSESVRRSSISKRGDFGVVGAPDLVAHNERDGPHQFRVATPDVAESAVVKLDRKARRRAARAHARQVLQCRRG